MQRTCCLLRSQRLRLQRLSERQQRLAPGREQGTLMLLLCSHRRCGTGDPCAEKASVLVHCHEACMVSGLHPGRLACYRERGSRARAWLDRTGSAARGGHPCALTPARPAAACLASGLFANADLRRAFHCMFNVQRIKMQRSGTVVNLPQAWMP